MPSSGEKAVAAAQLKRSKGIEMMKMARRRRRAQQTLPPIVARPRYDRSAILWAACSDTSDKKKQSRLEHPQQSIPDEQIRRLMMRKRRPQLRWRGRMRRRWQRRGAARERQRQASNALESARAPLAALRPPSVRHSVDAIMSYWLAS